MEFFQLKITAQFPRALFVLVSTLVPRRLDKKNTVWKFGRIATVLSPESKRLCQKVDFEKEAKNFNVDRTKSVRKALSIKSEPKKKSSPIGLKGEVKRCAMKFSE